MLRSFRAWLRTRNAAIVARRTADAERTKGPAELRRCAVCGRASHGVVRCLNCGRDLCVQHKDVVDGFHAADWLMAKALVCSSGRGLSLAVEDPTPAHGCSEVSDPFGGWDCLCGQGSWTKYGCTAPTDDLVALAAGVDVNPVPTYPEPICRHQWPVPPEGGADHTVPHVCVRLDKHRRHKCASGAWGLEIGVRT